MKKQLAHTVLFQSRITRDSGIIELLCVGNYWNKRYLHTIRFGPVTVSQTLTVHRAQHRSNPMLRIVLFWGVDPLLNRYCFLGDCNCVHKTREQH